MRTLLEDLRFTLRQLRGSPGFTITTVLTLALGIGSATAIFSLIDAVLLRPLPFPGQDRLVWVQKADQTLPAGNEEPLSYPDFFDWRARNRTLAGIACYHGDSATLTGAGEPRHLGSQVVSTEFFRVLGVHPMLGRDFRPEEEKPGTRVAILSHELWQSAFGAANDIVGRGIVLDGRSYTVVGVLPAGAGFPISTPPPAFWTTLAVDAEGDPPIATEQRGADYLRVVARLRPGATAAAARADLSVIARNIASQFPDTNKPYTAAVVMPLMEHITGDVKPALRILFGAVLLVLLIACVNVAGLLLARSYGLRAELAVRAALGAGRWAIVRQVLTEAVCLSVCGAALGVLLSSWILDAMLRYVPESLPRAGEVSVDATVLGFVTLLALATGLLFGALPAWRASRLDPAAGLRDGGRSVTAGRVQSRLDGSLVIAETAIGMVLLVGSGLLIRSFVEVLRVDPGFDPHGVLTADLNLPDSRYPRQQRIEFYRRLLPELASLPGVESVAAGWPLPLAESRVGISFAIDGRPVPAGDEPSEALSVVTPDYFRTMRIPIVSGRAFTPRDETNAPPVAIVNERFARKYFPGENPVGKHIRPGLGDGTIRQPMREIVGVVGNVKRTGLTAEADAQYYLPWEQAVIVAPTLALRTAGNTGALAGALRARVGKLDRGIPLYRVRTLEELVSRATAEPRFHTLLLTSFAAMALLLAAVGMYAVLSYMVVQRTAEIGVRMALGARRADVVGMVIRRGLKLAGAGLAIGLAASAALTGYIRSLLYRVTPLDAGTFAAVTLLLLFVCQIACALPAWRASRLDPVRTLREQ
jgi:predicted permease